MTVQPIFDEIIDLIALLPPKQLLAFHPSDKMQKHINSLLEKKRDNNLNETERMDLEKVLILEHIVRMAKAKALKKMQS